MAKRCNVRLPALRRLWQDGQDSRPAEGGGLHPFTFPTVRDERSLEGPAAQGCSPRSQREFSPPPACGGSWQSHSESLLQAAIMPRLLCSCVTLWSSASFPLWASLSEYRAAWVADRTDANMKQQHTLGVSVSLPVSFASSVPAATARSIRRLRSSTTASEACGTQADGSVCCMPSIECCCLLL